MPLGSHAEQVNIEPIRCDGVDELLVELGTLVECRAARVLSFLHCGVAVHIEVRNVDVTQQRIMRLLVIALGIPGGHEPLVAEE